MKQGFLLINYFASFYIIFRRTSQCLLVLREQLNFVEEEDIHSLHGTLNTKYTMFKYVVLIPEELLTVFTPKAFIHVAHLILFCSSGDFRVQCRWQQWHSLWYGLHSACIQRFLMVPSVWYCNAY